MEGRMIINRKVAAVPAHKYKGEVQNKVLKIETIQIQMPIKPQITLLDRSRKRESGETGTRKYLAWLTNCCKPIKTENDFWSK